MENACALVFAGFMSIAVAAAPSPGWDNVCPSRRMNAPVKELWRAPLEKGMEAFRVDWRGGATGAVAVVDGALRIEKGNADGLVVVTVAEPFAAANGLLLQGHAACYDESPVDPFEAKAYIRLWSGKEDMKWERRHFNGATADSPLFMQLMNTPPGHFTRKLCRTRVGDAGKVTAAIVVEGPPSVTTWREWGIEDAVAADMAWKKMNASRTPPDRADTMMDESAFDAALAADTEHAARLAKTPMGGVLEVDGKLVPPIIYKPTPFGHGVPFTGEGRALEGAGVDLQTVNIRLGVGFGRIGFWTTNGFDCAGAVRRVKDFMRSAPHSLFFVTIRCDAYPEYADEHPDEKWLRPDGSVVYGSCSQGQKKASPKPPPHTWPWVSNHSLVWRNDVKRLMSEFVAELRRTGLAKRIVGVHLAGYHDGQFAVPVADFSKPAAAAFREWQKAAHGCVKWDKAPEFPKGQELLDPIRDEAQIAYQKFLKWGPMRMQDDLARHLKAAFGKPIVVGRWCMNTFGGSIMATLDFTPFTRSESLDFLVAQPHYSRRAPGLDCAVRPPLGSFRLHGKMFLNEFDLRTWTGRSGENEARGIFLSEATDLPMWETTHRKLAGQMFANRMGWWYFDMSDNWFGDPAMLMDIASVRRTAASLVAAAPSPWKPSVAVVVDEEGLMLRNRIGIDLSMREVKNTPWQMQDFGASAVPYDIVLAQDFMDDPSRIDGYKVAVMSGFYQIDARRKTLISTLRQKGVKLVFLADSGACGGAEACEGSVRIAEPRGLTPKMLNALVREAGGYVPSRTGIQVDMNGEFISIHCLMTGHYDFALPFVADVENLKTGERRSAIQSIPLDMTGGETRWYRLTCAGCAIPSR